MLALSPEEENALMVYAQCSQEFDLEIVRKMKEKGVDPFHCSKKAVCADLFLISESAGPELIQELFQGADKDRLKRSLHFFIHCGTQRPNETTLACAQKFMQIGGFKPRHVEEIFTEALARDLVSYEFIKAILPFGC